MKTGLILEGGAMRGIYTAGVLDFLLEAHTRIKQSEDVLEGIFLEEQGYLSET